MRRNNFRIVLQCGENRVALEWWWYPWAASGSHQPAGSLHNSRSVPLAMAIESPCGVATKYKWFGSWKLYSHLILCSGCYLEYTREENGHDKENSVQKGENVNLNCGRNGFRRWWFDLQYEWSNHNYEAKFNFTPSETSCNLIGSFRCFKLSTVQGK